MTDVSIDLRDLPSNVGTVIITPGTPKRFYARGDIEHVWDHIQEKIVGLTDVSLTVIGFMPLVMPAVLASYAIDAGVQAFYICKPGGLVENVYDWRPKRTNKNLVKSVKTPEMMGWKSVRTKERPL